MLSNEWAREFGGGWSLRPLGASGFCDTWCAARADKRLFVKSGQGNASRALEAEADGLQALARSNTVRVPRVEWHGEVGGSAVLALEWLDLVTPDSKFGERFGHAMGALHAAPSPLPSFGWMRDNFIGATPQRNTLTLDWIDFFAHHRLGAMAERLGPQLAAPIQAVIEALPSLFDDGYAPRASLVHGDLWQGNWGMLADGTPVIYDPAVSCSDREADLAMMELFGNVPSGFWAAYSAVLPLSSGYEKRRPAYQLYHLLNHAVLFGGGYASQALQLAKRIASSIG